jgi:putative transposase
MHERTTNLYEPEKGKKTHPSAEASNPQGMGSHRQWGGGCPEVSSPSSNPLPLEKSPGTRSSSIPQRHEAQGRSPRSETGNGKPKAEGGSCASDPGIDAFKKRDELGLTNRPKGSTYSKEQRQRIIEEVQRLSLEGVPKSQILKALGVCRSTYYEWTKERGASQRKLSALSLTVYEKQAIIDKKKTQAELTHRKISGSLRHDGFWISPSSCYRVLKPLGWVLHQDLREAPWKVPHYEPFRPNQVWGEDWTILSIANTRYYLLTIIDYFSRYIVAWGVVKTVTQREVQNLLALAYLSEGIEQRDPKPILRADQGSPNMARETKRLIRDLEMVLSPSRAYRPTDNARQERWYRSVKQEEIYCYPTYPTEEIARSSIAKYIRFYHEERPHQALWNYTPGFVHRLGNNTELLEHHRTMVRIVKEQRINLNGMGNEYQPMAVSN